VELNLDAMSNGIIPLEQIARRIIFLRGEKVMLGQDLAKLYGVTVSALIQAVKRNADRYRGRQRT
jgi:hypothetical protein